MRSSIAALVTCVSIALTSGSAAAQSGAPSRLSLGATGGFGQTWDDEGSIGTGWLAGACGDVRLLSHTDAEFSVDWLRHDRSTGAFQAEGHTTFVSAALRQRFGGDRANGYVLGGVTLGAHTGTAGFPAENLINHNSSTHGGFMFGGGLSFRVGERMELGPVIRIAVLGANVDSDPASAIMAGFRIGLR